MKNHWLQQRKQKQKQFYNADLWRTFKQQMKQDTSAKLFADTSQLNFILGKLKKDLQAIIDRCTHARVEQYHNTLHALRYVSVPIYKGKQLIKVNRPFDHLNFLEWCECDDSELHELMFDIDDDEFDDDVWVVGDDEPQGAD